MTTKELEVAAEAIRQLAVKYGVSFYINQDKCREIAATAINAYLSVHTPPQP